MIADAKRIAAAVAGTAIDRLTVVAGGDTRHKSVEAGIAALELSIETVLVHDSARAFTPEAQFETVIAAVRATGAGVAPGVPVADTIKEVDANFRVEGTVDRSRLVGMQTPQGFPREQLVAAYAASTDDATDDAAVFAAAGHEVTVVAGDPLAFKITTPFDLWKAESLESGPASHSSSDRRSTAPTALAPHDRDAIALAARAGLGIDVHAFDESRPLWLGGLYWENEPGLAGHSDGDAVCHAICDALLSAAGLGDIGGRFGSDNPSFLDAHGEVFIAETVRLVEGAGFAIANVSVQVVANHPRLSTRRVEMEAGLTALVGAPVSVSATTSDGLGFTGRGEGLSAVATALISKLAG
jgi:2-C-methyl-D-erythritol 4-phosphate cytidylyltransferase / 2-C-methyl-D-erythritol 2,4-cyclodiphosphate synthase